MQKKVKQSLIHITKHIPYSVVNRKKIVLVWFMMLFSLGGNKSKILPKLVLNSSPESFFYKYISEEFSIWLMSLQECFIESQVFISSSTLKGIQWTSCILAFRTLESSDIYQTAVSAIRISNEKQTYTNTLHMLKPILQKQNLTFEMDHMSINFFLSQILIPVSRKDRWELSGHQTQNWREN